MAYVAVSGGSEAISESIELLKLFRSSTDKDLDLEALEKKLSLLVDRVMSEAGLYNPTYAALALKQCEGSIEEAVFLLRAYRSTLSRNYYTKTVNTDNMRMIRRLSSAFKDILGGQILGPSYDYTHRLINFDCAKEDAKELYQERQNKLKQIKGEESHFCPRVSDSLREQGIIETFTDDDTPPFDVTANLLEFPSSRSARLQTLTRADAGFVGGMGYSSLRGFGMVHPTIGELRQGFVELEIEYLFKQNESIYIGEILISEVESFCKADDNKKLKISVGYGVVFGRNENKAIAMSVIDRNLDLEGESPVNDEEFVLMHGDSLEMNGFISHLKLPHYVTFQSKLDSVRKSREGKINE